MVLITHMEELLETKSSTTKHLYMVLLKGLKKQITPKTKEINFLYNTDKVLEVLNEKYSTKSKRTYLGYIIGMLKLLKKETARKSKKIDNAISVYKKHLKETKAVKRIDLKD